MSASTTLSIRRAHQVVASACALLAVVLVTACGGTASPTPTEDGQQFDLDPGDRFEVVMRENVTVGESWGVSSIDDEVVVQVGSKRHRHDSDEDGSAGYSTFEFEAVASGAIEIEFEQDYRGEEIVDRMSVTVDVQP